MKPENKWKLPSGLYVEDIIYEHFQDREEQSICHSWVIDITDKTLNACFDTKDWEPIVATVPAIPKSDPVLIRWLARFGKVCISTAFARYRLTLKMSSTALLAHLEKTGPNPDSEAPELVTDLNVTRSWIYDVLRRWYVEFNISIAVHSKFQRARLCSTSVVFAEDHCEYWCTTPAFGTLFLINA